MISLLNLSSIVSIFKGDSVLEILEHRGDFVIVNEVEFKLDITTSNTSKISFYDNEEKIKVGDLIYKAGNNEIVAVIKAIEFKDNVSTCEVALDFDMLDLQILMINSVFNFQVGQVFSRNTPYEIFINFNEVVTSTDVFTSLDTLLRQAYRKKHLKIDYSIVDNKLRLTISPTNQVETKISFHEIVLIECNIKFGNDKFNMLRLYNKEDLSLPPKVYYLDKNGNITATLTNDVIRPIIDKSIDVEVDNYQTNYLAFATSELKKQDYDNEIIFKVGELNSNLIRSLSLGTKVLFYDKFGNEIRSILSKIEYKNGEFLITLGVSRRRFTDQKNQDK